MPSKLWGSCDKTSNVILNHPWALAYSDRHWMNTWSRQSLDRSRPELNYGAGRDFRVGPEFGATRKQPIIRERDRVLVKKIGSRDSIFGLVNSTYSFEITNHNQHASNIKYLANLIKKYWTYFRYQKLADFLVCFPPSVRVQVRWPPSWKICLKIQLSFGFWGRAVKAFDNFSRKLAWLLKTIF